MPSHQGLTRLRSAFSGRRPLLLVALAAAIVVTCSAGIWVGIGGPGPRPASSAGPANRSATDPANGSATDPANGSSADDTTRSPVAAAPSAASGATAGPLAAGPTPDAAMAPGAGMAPGGGVAPGAGVVPRGSAAAPAAPAEVTARIRKLLGRRTSDRVSVAALDLTDNRRYRYPSGSVIRTSGVVKLDILETVLLHAQKSGHPLSPDDAAQATAMIEHDDNNAADTLWDSHGGADGFRAANRELGTTHTSPDVDRYWGLATSDADDQLTLLRNLVQERPLDAASRTFALGLLGSVDPRQAWGVNAAADRGSAPVLKTGSINADNDNGLWTAGSVGIIEVRRHRVLLAVLTQHNPTRQAGIDLVNRLATTVVAAVAAAP